MVSLFITAFVSVLAILLIGGIGLYFWQKPARDDSERILPPSPDFHGLFGSASSKSDEEKMRAANAARENDNSALLDRARHGERSSLLEAERTGDRDLYDRVLNELVAHVASDSDLLSLMSYVKQNELRVNQRLAKAVQVAWRMSPNRSNTAKALHFAALSDDSDLYRATVEEALELWRDGKLPDISALELRALFDGEFWILSARTRSSGAGFVLKRTLDSARRELETARAEQ
jgi:hypothetical protein